MAEGRSGEWRARHDPTPRAPGRGWSALDPESLLDAVLGEVDEVAAEDSHRRLRPGVHANRVTNPPLAARLVDVAVDAGDRPGPLDRPAGAGRPPPPPP